jgi:glyoxylase I family protein
MKLKTLMIFVTDLEVAKHFYGQVLGFRLKSELSNQLIFSHDGCDLVAFKCEKNTIAGDYSQEARSVFVFEVASIDLAFRDLKARGVRFLHDRPARNSFARYAAFVDPFGIVHEISETNVAESPSTKA